MSASAWADYLDARLRLAHQWHDEGLAVDQIADRLTTDVVDVVRILLSPPEPPIPGSSRDRVRTWKHRTEQLERELAERGARITTAPPSVPVESQVRALVCTEDPYACGCQYWVEKPRPGEHHPHCAFAPKPKGSA